jgi:hypothetical protein
MPRFLSKITIRRSRWRHPGTGECWRPTDAQWYRVSRHRGGYRFCQAGTRLEMQNNILDNAGKPGERKGVDLINLEIGAR